MKRSLYVYLLKQETFKNKTLKRAKSYLHLYCGLKYLLKQKTNIFLLWKTKVLSYTQRHMRRSNQQA